MFKLTCSWSTPKQNHQSRLRGGFAKHCAPECCHRAVNSAVIWSEGCLVNRSVSICTPVQRHVFALALVGMLVNHRGSDNVPSRSCQSCHVYAGCHNSDCQWRHDCGPFASLLHVGRRIGKVQSRCLGSIPNDAQKVFGNSCYTELQQIVLSELQPDDLTNMCSSTHL